MPPVTAPIPETPETAPAWRRALGGVAIDAGLLRRRRDFRLLVVGQTLSDAGSMATFVAVPFQTYELTGSSLAVGLLGAAEFAPILVLALSAARWPTRSIAVGSCRSPRSGPRSWPARCC